MPESSPPPVAVSVKEAAELMGCSAWQMNQLLIAGRIQSRYLGRRRLVDYASLQSFFYSLPTAPASDEAVS